MGYSESRKTLDKIRPMLVNLESGKGDIWRTAPGQTARSLAYKIREALRIAALHPETYPQLAAAAKVFKIQIVDHSRVQAVLTDRQTGLPGFSEGGVVIHGLEDAAASPLKVMGQQSAARIIEHIINTQTIQPTNSQFSFPEARLSREEKIRLHNWCRKQTPPWIMLVADDAITVSRKSRDITEDLGWSPEDDD